MENIPFQFFHYATEEHAVSSHAVKQPTTAISDVTPTHSIICHTFFLLANTIIQPVWKVTKDQVA